MSPGETIALNAMKKEYKALARRAANAAKRSQDAIHAMSNILKVRQKASEIINSDKSWEERAKLMEPLANEEKRLIKLTKLDLSKLFSNEHELKFAAEDLAREIQSMEYRHRLRSA